MSSFLHVPVGEGHFQPYYTGRLGGCAWRFAIHWLPPFQIMGIVLARPMCLMAKSLWLSYAILV